MIRRPPRSTLFPSRRSSDLARRRETCGATSQSDARSYCTTARPGCSPAIPVLAYNRSEEHTSELQSQSNIVCRLLLEKKKNHPPYLLVQSHIPILCLSPYQQ